MYKHICSVYVPPYQVRGTYTLSLYKYICSIDVPPYQVGGTCALSMYKYLYSIHVPPINSVGCILISIPMYIYSTYVTPYQVRGTYTRSRTYIYTLPMYSPIKFVGRKLYLYTRKYMERTPHENNLIFFHNSLVCTG